MIRRDFHLVDDTAMSTVCLHATTLSGTCKNREGKGCGRKIEKFSRTHKLKRTVVVAACTSSVVISFMRQDNFPLSVPLELLLFSFHPIPSFYAIQCQAGRFILPHPSVHPSIHSAVVLEKLERHYPSSLVIQSDCIPWQQTIRRTDWVCAK